MKLRSDLRAKGPVRIAVIGAGMMGAGLIAQLKRVEGMDLCLWSSRRKAPLLKKAKELGLIERGGGIVRSLREAREIRKKGGVALTTDNALAWEMDEVDVIVDCTGNTEAGARINDEGLNHGKHIVSFNVECDVLLGPYFREKAKNLNLCYTGTAGDEPGSVMELYNFATFLGFRVVAAGKGKNNPMDTSATPESLKEKAEAKGLSPRMLTSFVDATNTMIELNAVANATGLLPDVAGCHGLHSDIEGLDEAFKLKEEGGIIEKKGIVEYVRGIAPGVFVVIETDDPLIRREMPYLSMGDGPRYVLYRPYHLTNIETPLTIAKAFLYREATISPEKGYIAHTVAVAKRDLEPGEALSGIGSDTTYGVLVDAEICYKKAYVPIGLLVGDAKVKRRVSKGETLRFEDIVLDDRSELVKMFAEEHAKFYALPIFSDVV